MPTQRALRTIETHPLTPERWRDFAALMNSRFDTRRCWCMWPRSAVSYKTRTGDANRRLMKKAVDSAPFPPGVLAYIDGIPAGWCAVAPRGDYPRLGQSSVTAPLDDEPVWSVVCFYVLRPYRRRGMSRALLAAALDLAKQHGARPSRPIRSRAATTPSAASRPSSQPRAFARWRVVTVTVPSFDTGPALVGRANAPALRLALPASRDVCHSYH